MDKPQTIQELLDILTRKVPLSRETILDAVSKLQKQGKISFKEQPSEKISSNLGLYLTTKDAFWYWTTVALTLLCSVAVIGFEAIGLQGLIRFVPGALLVLGLPGYSLTRIMFTNKFAKSGKTQNFDSLMLFAFSIVLSIVSTSIVGLLLNYTEWGVQLSSLVLSLSFLTLFFASVALYQENRNLKSMGELENGAKHN
jgi:hypothetical protein